MIINFKTASATELTALKIKKTDVLFWLEKTLPACLNTVMEIKDFTTYTDCSKFKVLLSTEQTDKKLEKYDIVGLNPDCFLNNKSDWIEQTLNITKERN